MNARFGHRNLPPDLPESALAKLFGTGVRYGLSNLAAPPCARDTKSGRERRDAQFRAGRALGRRLLAQLGAGQLDIGVAPDRSPIWPEGIVGSISHSDGLAFIAAARRGAIAALGIDVEPVMPTAVAIETSPLLFDESELSLVAGATDFPLSATILFSAKEAFFKCAYPAVGCFFDFRDVRMCSVDPEEGQLHLRLLRTLSEDFSGGRVFRGRFAVAANHVFSVFEHGRTSS